MASIKDIAKELGLAVSTVSMALNGNEKINENTRLKVEEAAKKMNYVKNGIAVDLQRKRTNTILLVLEDASRNYFSKFIGEFQENIAKYNYDLLIATTFKGNTTTALRYISERRADGVVVFTNKISDETLLKYSEQSCPIIAINREIVGKNLFSVYTDNKEGGCKATEYLIQQGHTKIAFIKGSSKTIGSQLRYEGFESCVNKHNLQDKCTFIDAEETTDKAGYYATLELLKTAKDIEAIFYSSDDMAIGGIKALKEQGLSVPEDVSIIGYNNSEVSRYISPALTTVSTDIDTATEAARILVKALKNEAIDEKIIRGGSTIVVRESVKRRE